MLRNLYVVLLCLAPAVTWAGSVSFSHSGFVDQVFRDAPAPFSDVQIGDPIHVDYTLEVDTPDQDAIADLGTFSGAVVTYEVRIGDASATTTFGGVNTSDKGPLATEDTYAAVGLFENYSATVSLQDPSGNALTGTDDLTTIDLSSFSEKSFLLLNGVFPSISGTMVVPEPGGHVLALGLLLLLVRRQHRIL